jgi:hypothetical protein
LILRTEEPGSQDEEDQVAAAVQLIGRHVVVTELIFNRLDVLLKEWRMIKGIK